MARPLVGVITNPNSKKNRLNPARYEAMRETVGDLGIVRRTQDTAEIAGVVRAFLDAGIPYWVADGGDGAFHWLTNVAQQVLAERGGKDTAPAIMPTNAGTIDFVGRKCGVIGDSDGLLRALCATLRAGQQPGICTIDSLRVRGVYGPDSDWPGRTFDKLGFALALAGIGQRFFDKFYAHENQGVTGILEVVGGILFSATMQAPGLRKVPLPVELRHYSDTVFEPLPADVWIDGEKLPMRDYRAINVGSIDLNLAGVFRIFPFAREGGVLHVMAGDPSVNEVIRNLPSHASGRKMVMETFVERAAHSLRVVALDGKRIDPCIDGELFYGLTEADVTLGPPVRVVQMNVHHAPTDRA